MIHLGDITKINGAAVPAVNVIIGGSPCQDLSIAGKRAGLAGERSGLFMEQIRIVKEAREADEARGRRCGEIRPRFMLWENVPGAFSSNKGADFGAVLQETIRVVCEETPAVPMPDKGWPMAGCLYGEGGDWSVAWRVFDAQFWGVPQRRRRIALVADFGGITAPEILFERESLSGDSQSCGTPWQGSTPGTEASTDSASKCQGYGIDHVITTGGNCTAQGPCVYKDLIPTLKAAGPHSVFCIRGNAVDRDTTANGGFAKKDVSYTLNTVDRHAVCAGFAGRPGAKSGSIGYAVEQAPTLLSGRNDASVLCLNDQGGSIMGVSHDVAGTLRAQEHGHQPLVMAFDTTQITSPVNGSVPEYGKPCHTINANAHVPAVVLDMTHACDVIRDCGSVTPSLQARMGTGGNQVPLVFRQRGFGDYQSDEVGSTCKQRDSKDATDLVVTAVDCRNGTESSDINGTLQAKESGGSSLNLNNVCRVNMMVRRLTPLECERLQGFPDGWTDLGDWVDSKGKLHKDADSPRYKALGNSIALPSWFYVLSKLSLCCAGDWTMASLFDGIGGFPLIWETLHGQGSCRWASEIEEFPMAVTKKHFP